MRRIFAAAFLALAMVSPALAQNNRVDERSLTLRAGDLLRIRVWPDSSLGGDYTVEETGTVHLPMIGEFKAAGRTLADVRTDLRARYRESLRIPIVTVTPFFRVSILGAVERPGLYTIDPTHTLMDVVSLAGGFTREAKTQELVVVRNGQRMEINADESAAYNIGAANILMESGDRIVVPARRGSNTTMILSLFQSAAILTTLILQLR